jgi:DNA-binding CsgD family transcriptional regulator
VHDRALKYCLDLTDSRFGFIGLLNDRRDQMVVAAIIGFVPSIPGFVQRNRFMSVRLSVFGVVLVENRPYISNDVEHDPLRVGQPKGHPPVERFLGVPLRVAGSLIGVLGVANKADGYGSEDERLLSTFANQVAIAIDNARLYQQQRDVITRLVSVVDLATSTHTYRGVTPGGSARLEAASEAPSRHDADSGAVVEPSGGGGLEVLTDGQREIVTLVAQGYSNREIAARVHLSENTVKTHLRQIYRALGVHNRVEAAIRAMPGAQT